MTHGSLFSGIDGFSLAADWMGWQTLFTCEKDEFCNMVIKEHRNNIQYGDIKTTDFTVWRGRIDIITGGFPCQPYSVAGKRKGKDDDRHLWPEMLRAIREISPRWVVGENVRGITNWNGGLVFDEVQSDLEALGYEVQPFILPACAVNAPHRRDRVWFVAYSPNARVKGLQSGGEYGIYGFKVTPDTNFDLLEQRRTTRNRNEDNAPFRANIFGKSERFGKEQITTNSECPGLERYDEWQGCAINWKNEWIFFRAENKLNAPNPNSGRQPIKEYGKTQSGFSSKKGIPTDWRDFPTQSPVCVGDDGFPTGLLRQRLRELSNGLLGEKEIDKIISKAVTKIRTESIKAGGNAVVPPLVLKIFKAIENYEKSDIHTPKTANGNQKAE